MLPHEQIAPMSPVFAVRFTEGIALGGPAIEILWRFMKYEWMDFSAYENWPSLVAHVENMLRGFGQEFVINFA